MNLSQTHPGLCRAVRSACVAGAAVLATTLLAPAAQAQTTATPTLGCALGTVPVLSWSTACQRPYGTTSPFNKPLPAAPRVSARSAAIIAKVISLGPPNNLVAGQADTAADWGHPIYWPKTTDPLFTLDCTEAWGLCPIEGMKIRIPDKARAAGGSDAHMTIMDAAGGWEYDLWDVASKPLGGGTLKFAWGGRTQINGTGLNSYATAARFGNAAGMIRAQELKAGRIDHALFMTVDCDGGNFVWPATQASGRTCADKTNAPPLGTRFQLNMSVTEINALAVPAWKKTILRAMAEYGTYMGDVGGRTWGLMFESGSSYTSFGVEDPIETFGRQNGVTMWKGDYVFDLKTGVDYANRLRVIEPCVAQGTC